MIIGFNRSLYILPFDHRGTFQTQMFGRKGALTPGTVSRQGAVAAIANRYREFANIFEARACAAA